MQPWRDSEYDAVILKLGVTLVNIFMPREVRKNPGDLLTVGDIAKALTPTGRDLEKIVGLVRHYHKQSYLKPVAKETEGRQSFLYLPDQCLVAEMLIRMGEMGVADTDSALAVSRLFNVWRRDDYEGSKPPAPTPGMHIIRQYEQGARDWYAELWVLARNGRLTKTGRLHAIERGEATAWEYTVGDYEKRSYFSVDLTGVLDRIHPRTRRTIN
ncbi:hypothetical protein VSX64_21615 [Aurantimonas sp. C2-6-R+9]|uniref:hypothetical protein n=1 Tax=unclassified Aurantimonas TaxID=2638230 RepID=UPI002E182349|nr:hypothetical protein [Aurantimonas sp. C2-6-R+9]